MQDTELAQISCYEMNMTCYRHDRA